MATSGVPSGAVRELYRLVDRLSAAVGPSRRRQLRWVAGELALYQDWVPAPDLAGLLESGYLRAYLAVAERGMLRRRGAVGTASPPGACRVRRACLLLLAQSARLPEPDIGDGPVSVLRDKVPPTAAQRAMRMLTAEARAAGARPGMVRAALVAGLVHHHDLRTGEIADLTLADIHPSGRSLPPLSPAHPAAASSHAAETSEGTGEREGVRVTYRPAAPGVGPGRPVTLTLVPVVAEMLGLWLAHRERLVPVDRVRHLLVSVRGNHHHGVRRPAGLPLQPRGLMRAHANVIARLNQVLADRHGAEPDYAPLPRTLGELRPVGTPATQNP